MGSTLFGPNTTLIDDFRRRLESWPWFTRIETPHPQDDQLVRVPLKFLLDKPTDPWNGAAGEAEIQIDRRIIDSARVSEQYLVDKAFQAPWRAFYADKVLETLQERYPGYYGDRFRYAEELLDFPERTIRYALFECLVDDIQPRVMFFRDLMPWFEEGYWPCGWQGNFPQGQLILL